MEEALDEISRLIASSQPAHGSPALIRLPLSARHFAAALACWRSQHPAVLASTRATPRELAHIRSIATPGLTIHAAPNTGLGLELANRSKALGPHDAVVAFTSGSTGRAKGAVLEAGAVLHNATRTAEFLGLTESDRVLVFTPPHFTYANVQAFAALLHGATVLAWPHGTTSPTSLTAFAREHAATVVCANPSAFEIWLRAGTVLPEIRAVVSAGQPTSARHAELLRSAFPKSRVITAYGCTENVNRITFYEVESLPPPDQPTPVGRPIDGVAISLADDGEVMLRGESLMRGYLHELRSNEDRMSQFATGDLGAWTSDGELMLLGRKKTLINVGNEMVSPEEVELVIGEVEGVAACAAGAFSHDILGEAVAVICVVHDAESDSAVQERVKAAVGSSLSRAKRPQRLLLTRDPEAIPRTEYGKIDRAQLARVLSAVPEGA